MGQLDGANGMPPINSGAMGPDDLDAVANREIIYISFGLVIFGWLFLRFHSVRASSS